MAGKMARAFRALTFLEALLFSGLVAMFIWRWQAGAPHSWIVFPVWLVVSFLLRRDTPKTLGWRADNFWPATRQGFGQAILGGLTWWAFPVVWHHSMRAGPGYYSFANRLVHW
jgi:hypothetical protein